MSKTQVAVLSLQEEKKRMGAVCKALHLYSSKCWALDSAEEQTRRTQIGMMIMVFIIRLRN